MLKISSIISSPKPNSFGLDEDNGFETMLKNHRMFRVEVSFTTNLTFTYVRLNSWPVLYNTILLMRIRDMLTFHAIAFPAPARVGLPSLLLFRLFDLAGETGSCAGRAVAEPSCDFAATSVSLLFVYI